jgi:renal tumor antigen
MTLMSAGEGTFSEVLAAQNIKTGDLCAIKCMKQTFESLDQVNNLREIQALRRLSPHNNIIKLHEVLYDKPTGRLALVFELMSFNMYELIRGRRRYLDPGLVKIYAWQMMQAVAHGHRKGIFHRGKSDAQDYPLLSKHTQHFFVLCLQISNQKTFCCHPQ